MSARCRIMCLIAAVLLSAPAVQAGEAKPVQKVYSVADLVIPVADAGGDKPAGRTSVWAVSREKTSGSPVGVAVTTVRPRGTREDDLIRAITRTIAPHSWAGQGGAGTIDYFPLTMSLVVSQTPAIQDQVEDLLNALRREQDMEVSVEVKFADITEDVMQNMRRRGRLGETGEKSHGRGDATFLDDAGVRRFLDAIQEDVRSNVMQAPKMTMFNGQKVAFNSGDEQHFVTGLEIVAVGDRVEYRPKMETVPLGTQIGLQSVVSEDRRSVRVNFQAKLTNLESGDVPMFPITTPAPEEEKGPDGKPRTVTHYIQQPRVLTLGVDRTLLIPDGHTAVLMAGARQGEKVMATKVGVPILCEIPFLGDFFSTFECHPETHHLVVLVTPRILVAPEEEHKRTKAPSCEKTICTREKAASTIGHKDARTWILPAVGEKERVRGEGPADSDVLRALPPTVQVPFICRERRDDLQIVKERLTDELDAPRFFPLVGPARLHRCHWKCTVSYDETITGRYPFAFHCKRPRRHVVYLDTDHLHLCADGEK